MLLASKNVVQDVTPEELHPTSIRRAVQYEPERPVGMGGGERDRSPSAVGEAKHDRALAAGRGHHRLWVAHAVVKTRELDKRVGQPGPALVELDQTAASRQCQAELAVGGLLPVQLQVRN